MTAFDDASEVEKLALLDLLPYLERRCEATPHKTHHQLVLQKYAGDLLIQVPGRAKFIELKAEREDKYERLFLETWSNRSRFTVGWMFTSRADWLWYYFVEERRLFHVEFDNLKRWAFGQGDNQGAIYSSDFPERKQKKREQKNDTWGRAVAYSILKRDVPSFCGPINPVRELQLAGTVSIADAVATEDSFWGPYHEPDVDDGSTAQPQQSLLNE
ncbi:hypothetical protein LCGC14_0776350 [marine sediment metagenome]|uniref:Uncharacterized protein n=1 Tax=marine sediment metagenome TaxID=412755 RepID=A0A0F9QGM3_9ZZZZ